MNGSNRQNTLNDLLPVYRSLIQTTIFSDKARKDAPIIASEIIKNRKRYEIIEIQTTVPWWFTGTLHQMEASGDFNCHLANGDPLTARTVNEPVGLPKIGKPPFTWEEAAAAVLFSKGWSPENTGLVWNDLARCLWRMEAYNGFGYRLYHPECLTPYLWSGTNHYSIGKYASDGKWVSTLVSDQLGCVPIIAALNIFPELRIEKSQT